MSRPWPAEQSSARGCRALLGRAAFAVLVAAASGASLAQQPDVVSSIAAENAGSAAQIAAAETALERARADLARLHKSKDELEESMPRIVRRAQVHALGREFAQTVIERLRLLPRPELFAAARGHRGRMLEATSDANVRTERALDELGDLDAVVARRLAATARTRWPSASPAGQASRTGAGSAPARTRRIPGAVA